MPSLKPAGLGGSAGTWEQPEGEQYARKGITPNKSKGL